MNPRTWAVIFLLACGACEGPAGPMGLAGDAGPRGAQGEPGEDGEDGRDGNTGDRGPRGEPGEDGLGADAGLGVLVEQSVLCSVIDGAWLFTHRITRFADGAVIAHCSIGTQNSEFSASAVFVAEQAGAADASCSLTADNEQDGTAGWWAFEYDGRVSIAEYNDTASAVDGEAVELDCVTFP